MQVQCPLCKGTNLSYVLFGYPSEGMIEAEATGHFILGGCVVKDEHWLCKDCEKLVHIKAKMPCSYCETCQFFVSPDDIKIEENEDSENWICLKCHTIIKSKKKR